MFSPCLFCQLILKNTCLLTICKVSLEICKLFGTLCSMYVSILICVHIYPTHEDFTGPPFPSNLQVRVKIKSNRIMIDPFSSPYNTTHLHITRSNPTTVWRRWSGPPRYKTTPSAYVQWWSLSGLLNTRLTSTLPHAWSISKLWD